MPLYVPLIPGNSVSDGNGYPPRIQITKVMEEINMDYLVTVLASIEHLPGIGLGDNLHLPGPIWDNGVNPSRYNGCIANANPLSCIEHSSQFIAPLPPQLYRALAGRGQVRSKTTAGQGPPPFLC